MENCLRYQQKPCRDSHNLIDYLRQRDLGKSKGFVSANGEYGTHQMINKSLFKENLLRVGTNTNKIFCSKWLTTEQIVMGTKCSQLLLYDVKTKKVDHIPCLKGHHGSECSVGQFGIHAMEMNPSKTLMATGAQNSNEIAFYHLPSWEAICTGEKAHVDCVFDLCWLDDQFLVSVSRDGSLAIWKMDQPLNEASRSSLNYGFIEPLSKKKCTGADKIRSAVFNANHMVIVALSLNAKIHVFDVTLFQQIMSQKLELVNENVCMTKTENCSMYAIGSKSHVTLIDPRTLKSIKKIDTKKSGPNIRSISFKGSLLTIGTGCGDILFYDVEGGKYRQEILQVHCSKCKGTLENPEHRYQSLPNNPTIDSAIYTHCYDWSGTRLFAGGGPLSAAFRGSYAAVWC